MTPSELIRQEAEEQLARTPIGQPCLQIPLEFVSIDHQHENAYITFENLAKAFEAISR